MSHSSYEATFLDTVESKEVESPHRIIILPSFLERFIFSDPYSLTHSHNSNSLKPGRFELVTERSSFFKPSSLNRSLKSSAIPTYSTGD